MISYAVIGLAFILLIVFAVLTAKQWHWVNIVFLILTFLAGVAATGALAQCMQLRLNDMEAARDAVELAEKNKAAADKAVFGLDTSTEYDKDSLRGINQRLEREMMGRGRIWSRGAPSAVGENRGFTFSLAREAIAGMNTMVVYAFVDGPINVGLPDGTVETQIYPLEFVGSFRVIQETPASLTLEPLFIANSGANQNPEGTWSLYEKMPLDRRDAFKKVEGLTDDVDIETYRAILTQKYLPADRIGLAENSREYEALIDRFAFDGQRLGDIQNYINSQPNRFNKRFTAEKEEVFYLYEFNKAVREEKAFIVDGTGRLDADGAFTPLGRAVDPSLQLGRKVAPAQGDRVLIDQKTAEGYQRPDGLMLERFDLQYDVTPIDQFFFRPLNNYPYLLASLLDRSGVIADETARIEANNAVTKAALDNTEAQRTVRTDVVSGLTSDQQKLLADQSAIKTLNELRTKQLADLEQEIAMLQQQLDTVYAQILAAQ